MAEKLDGRDFGYFWNDDGSGDRTYNADSFEYWLKKFFTTGVFAGDLQVTAGGSYTVNVATGYANVNGKVREFYKTENFTVPSANSTYPRIDTIVVRRDDTNKIISLQYVTGTYSGRNPSATAPTRSGAIYELVLAEIYVGAGVTEILQRDITDKRADKTVCGIVTGTVEEVDFSQFASQFNSYYNEFKTGKQADFETWFSGIQNVLDGDTAGNLYNLIQENKAKLDGVAAGADQIAQNTAQIETAGTATNAHSVGEYVMISNALYKVTASVAKGDTWAIGTNVTAANIGSEISSLKSDLATQGDSVKSNASKINTNASAISTLNTNLANIKFGVDSDGNYGYIKPGADTVTPFSKLKQGEPFNISLSIPNDFLKNDISITFPKPPKMVIAQLPGHELTHYPAWLGFVNYDNKDTTINCDLATGWNGRGGGYSCTITVYWAY